MTNSHVVHHHPVWRSKTNFIVDVAIDTSYQPLLWEQLWVRQLAPFCFEVCCIPFMVYDLALGDEIETDGDYVVQRVVKPSGHCTFRIWFGREATEEDRESVVKDLGELGALMEWYSNSLLAVSIHSERAQPVVNYLQIGEDTGRFVYETGVIPGA